MPEATRVEPAPAPDDPQARRIRYNKAVREARLVTIFLSKVDFDVDRGAGTRKEIEDNSRRKYGSSIEQVLIDDDRKACLVTVRWEVSIKIGRKRVMRCAAVYDIMYDGFSSIDEDAIKLFAENVAQPAVYSYFRALYAHLDWSAELRSPPLPVVRFFPKV